MNAVIDKRGQPGRLTAMASAIVKSHIARTAKEHPTWTQEEIADDIERNLGIIISRQTVSYHLNTIIDKLMVEAEDDMKELLDAELARIDALELELWREWESSKHPIKKEILDEQIRLSHDDETSEEIAERILTNVRTIKEYGPGNLELLRLIVDLQKERRKLTGVYSAQKLDISGVVEHEVKGYASVSPDDWE